MKNAYKIASLISILTPIVHITAQQDTAPTTWCFMQKIGPNGSATNKKVYFEISEKNLRAAINRLENLYKKNKKMFIELNSKCIDPNYPLPKTTLTTLQKNHIANAKGEIYISYQKLVPLVFKITKVNPPQSKFIQFNELISTGAITKSKRLIKSKSF